MAALAKKVKNAVQNKFNVLRNFLPMENTMSELSTEIAKVLASNSCQFSKADEIRMLIPDVVGRLRRLYASTVDRRDAENQTLNRFIAEYKPDPVAEARGYDPIPQEAIMNEQTERVMFANIAVAIDAEKELFVIHICEQMGLDHKDRKGKADFGVACKSLKAAIGVDPRKLPGGDVHEQARVLANCYKHEGMMDAEAAEFLKGDVGDEIAFEELDWPAMIAATGQVLDEIVKRLD